MMIETYFTKDERSQAFSLTRDLLVFLRGIVSEADIRQTFNLIHDAVAEGHLQRGEEGLNPVLCNLRTVSLLCHNVFADRDMVIATMLHTLSHSDFISEQQIVKTFGDDVARLVHGLNGVARLYGKRAAVQNENFQKLLLTFADDIRVIIIMIVDRLALMRVINNHSNEQLVYDISMEARYLYAPLAHRLGLYQLKTELEDLSLKYLNRNVFEQISNKLNETKQHREKYVTDFILPIRNALQNAGLKFEIKGRTKSINSIWNKMKKQGVDLSGIYDLFAIRIILDSELDQEKKDCWVTYSIVTDIYTANTTRLRDWISIPKSNGYESLHITVNGPEERWVEVQIRTKRMDEVAERGLAAHWKYKGIKSEVSLDNWMNNVREMLEAGSDVQMELFRSMHVNLYDKEVFVFTPKGDLFQLPQGASLLDFAFAVHTRVGITCVGGKVDGKNQKLNYKLKNGDTIEVITASTQTPKLDWLGYVVTPKARNKIKQAVNEVKKRKAELGKELLQRRFKNRKIELDEATISRMLKRMGYKTLTDFYVALQDEFIDINQVLSHYEAQLQRKEDVGTTSLGSAQDFVLQLKASEDSQPDDILIIGDNVRGINYRLSKCCNPIFGDKIVGFVANDGAIKIHRNDCRNLQYLRSRFPYRIIRSAWSGKVGTQFAATLRVVGKDNIGIVSNITSVINKLGDTQLRNISINSNGDTFEGLLVIGINSTELLNDLIQRLQNLRGVSRVERRN